MPTTSFITLLTDFGTRDYFVASIKGVILGIHPQIRIIDISHETQPHNVLEAAFVLKSAYRYFPRSSIHMVIVDPGVGSERRPLLVSSNNYFFVAPDNGVLSWIYMEEPHVRVFQITAEHYFLKSAGATFHGRDVFAPVAAWLSKGVDCTHFGPEITEYQKLSFPQPIFEGERMLRGHILYIDRFGNLITDITTSHLDHLLEKEGEIELTIKTTKIHGLKSYYAQGNPGEPNALMNSCGHLELYCCLGNACEVLKASHGEEVILNIS